MMGPNRGSEVHEYNCILVFNRGVVGEFCRFDSDGESKFVSTFSMSVPSENLHKTYKLNKLLIIRNKNTVQYIK